MHAVLANEFNRVTTHMRLIGAGVDGLGDAPNDVAPSAYNEDDPAGELLGSPLDPNPAPSGFRRTA